MKSAIRVFAALTREDSGQELMEYALLAALLGVGAIAVMSRFSGTIGNAFGSVGDSLVNSI
jgi:pilus assembly protein Flp/PilA